MKKHPLNRHGPLIASFASLLFLVHPIQTQALNLITQRAASLATFFYLASMVLYLKARLTPRPLTYLGALLVALLGMFTKEITVTLPFTILLYEFSFLGPWRERTKPRLLLILPFLLAPLVIPLTLIQASPFTHATAYEPPNPSIPYYAYPLTQLNVVRTYLRLLVFPINQNLDYDYPISRSLLEPQTFLSLLLLVGIGFIALRLFKRQRLLFFGASWFFLALSPESSFLKLRDYIFEHRLYLPMVGASIFFSTALFLLLKETKRFIAVATLLILVFSVATTRRNEIWKDGITLWQDVIQKSPKKARGYNNLGVHYGKKGRYDKELEYCKKATLLDPTYAKPYTNLGTLYARRGLYDEALRYYRKAVELNPRDAKAYDNLGAAYMQKGLDEKALQYLNKASTLNPHQASVYNNLGALYGRRGHHDKAIRYYQKAVDLNPRFVVANFNLGSAYSIKGDQANVLKQADRLRALNRNDLADQLEKVSQ